MPTNATLAAIRMSTSAAYSRHAAVVAVVQTSVIHLLRNSFRYAGRQHYGAIAKALRPVYTAPTEQAAETRLALNEDEQADADEHDRQD